MPEATDFASPRSVARIGATCRPDGSSSYHRAKG